MTRARPLIVAFGLAACRHPIAFEVVASGTLQLPEDAYCGSIYLEDCCARAGTFRSLDEEMWWSYWSSSMGAHLQDSIDDLRPDVDVDWTTDALVVTHSELCFSADYAIEHERVYLRRGDLYAESVLLGSGDDGALWRPYQVIRIDWEEVERIGIADPTQIVYELAVPEQE